MPIVKRFVCFALIWLVLSRGEPGGWVAGLLAAASATAASLWLLPPGSVRADILGFARLVPGFLYRSLRGGIEIAWLALHPRMPIDGGWIAYRTALQDGTQRNIFGSEMSLLPGSLLAGGDEDVLYVHCLVGRDRVVRQLGDEEARFAAAWRPAVDGRDG